MLHLQGLGSSGHAKQEGRERERERERENVYNDLGNIISLNSLDPT